MLKEVQTVLDRIYEGRRKYKTWQQVVAVSVARKNTLILLIVTREFRFWSVLRITSIQMIAM